MGAPTWPPYPPTFVAPRRSRGAPLVCARAGAPTWPPYPPTFVAPRRSRGAPLVCARAGGPRHGPHTPNVRRPPGGAGVFLDIALVVERLVDQRFQQMAVV